ncbi:hypothetical protein PVAND_004853 [Polypedilum vanderplanki]|uniref:UDP-glucuronosyltransferase n=1 Tax=Polypedilum vanderplanki TaxID=319348 RepID=A0A9J6BYE3_POLVA|nr:hypothetical protein PVAND_004853 [Polypedilum vanderplanki]
MQVLAKALAKRGHEITFISGFPFDKPIENYRDIKIKLSDEDSREMEEMTKSMGGNPGSKSFFQLLGFFSRMFYKIGNDTLQSADVKKLMAEEQFDLVIAGYFMTEYLLGLATHFNCPSIVFFSGNLVSSLHKMVGNPLSPAGAPHGMLKSKEINTFKLRLQNFLLHGLDLLIFRPYFNYRARQIYNDNFPPNRYRSYDETLTNVSAVLINTHFTSAAPRPNLPNLIEVGGLQIKPKNSPLPDNLKNFLNNAKNGAILFSFGSNAKSMYLPEEKIKALLKVFSKLKQRVVMKWESDTLPGKPDNVIISKWLPQDDVLAHSSMRLFISHCGYGGIVEAKYYGVPIIGVPLGGDQASNAKKIVEEGWAIQINFEDLNEETLTEAINEILNNKKYSDYVKRESELSRDRPMHAQDTAIYWVEYILRHHGAPHLHYPGADLNFFQDNSIDVFLFIIAVLYATWKLLKFICKFCFCRQKKNIEKLKKN